MRIGRMLVAAVLMAILGAAPGYSAPGQAAGSVHGWWEGGRAFVKIRDSVLPRNPVARQAVAQLNAETGDSLWVTWHKDTGLPEVMSGKTALPYPGLPEDAAAAFASRYWSVLTGSESREADTHLELIPEAAKETGRGSVKVYLRPDYKGIPLWMGGITVEIDGDHHIVRAFSGFGFVDDYDLPSPLPPEVACASLIADLAPDSAVVRGEPRLWVYPTVPPRLAYQCSVDVRIRHRSRLSPFSLRNLFLVDANTGEVISVQNDFIVEHPIFPLPDNYLEDTRQPRQSGGPPPGYGGTQPVIKLEPREFDTTDVFPLPSPDSISTPRPDPRAINQFRPRGPKEFQHPLPHRAGAASPQAYEIADAWYTPQINSDGRVPMTAWPGRPREC